MSDGDYLRMLEDQKRIVELEAALKAALEAWDRCSSGNRPLLTWVIMARAAIAKDAPRITTNQGEKREAEPQTAAQNMKPAT